MSNFFQKTGIKLILALLCAISLTIAGLSGVCVGILLASGQYEAAGSVEASLANRQMQSDASAIMTGYFDPLEPTKPWVSYYSGGIYTGENSNFRYNITDDDTGFSVLATVEGGEQIRHKNQYHFSFEVGTENSVEDVYTVTSDAFICGGTVFLYDETEECFYPLENQRVSQHITGAELLDAEAMNQGFTYLPSKTQIVVSDDETATAEITEESVPDTTGRHFEYDGENFYNTDYPEQYLSETKYYTITCYVLRGLSASDSYQRIYELSNFLTANQYQLATVCAGSLLLGLVLLIMLGCVAGRVNGEEKPVLSTLFRVPTDALLVCDIVCVAIGAELTYELGYTTRFITGIVGIGLIVLLLAVLLVYTVCMLSARGKTHTLISGSAIYWCLKHIRMLFKWGRKMIARCFGYMPLLWKVGVCYAVLCFIEFIWLMNCNFVNGATVLVWLLERMVLGALVAYVTLAFRRLKRGAQSIAAGDYTTKVSETHLVMDFKETANTLNHIQDGMNAAVESRMKSERLKTELITNVSHDIKTPLTSIVTYVDLLKKEPMPTADAENYLAVLERQSARLKKLVEDLVEASKASTGNITIHAETMDISTILGQALGEYNERLADAGITPMVKLPETPVLVSADGRLLWRVFDNLLGNVVKYAMPGTRLYVTVTADTHAIVTMRNVSREPLDVSAEELKERFVRGDSSRHTEGSGLGLSIAESLTSSMGGEFILSVDGDLFKAAVILPIIGEKSKETE